MLICSKGVSKYLAVWMFRRLNFNKTSHLDRFEKEGNENVGRGGELRLARPPRPRLPEFGRRRHQAQVQKKPD